MLVIWCRRVQPTVGGVIPEQEDLECIRKVVEYDSGSKPINMFLCGYCFKHLP